MKATLNVAKIHVLCDTSIAFNGQVVSNDGKSLGVLVVLARLDLPGKAHRLYCGVVAAALLIGGALCTTD